MALMGSRTFFPLDSHRRLTFQRDSRCFPESIDDGQDG